ncbi:MAG: MFS transporter, partial [Candidatus Rokuibacteriota bacterium]
MATIPLPSRRSRLAVATIFFVNGAVLASWVAHIPGVKERHGIGDGSLGLVLLFMALGAVLALPLGGWLVDRFGSRLITSLAALVFCLALPWPLLSRDVTCLVTALVLLGACNAVLDVSMNAQAVAV